MPSAPEDIPVGEIASAQRSGGANTSHTIVVPALQQLLKAVPGDATREEYERAVLVNNVLGKDTAGARKRTFRYLKELYLLRPDSILFRAVRDLWADDPSGQPLLAGLCALARDTVFRASAGAIFETDPGDTLTNASLADAVAPSIQTSTTSRRSQRSGGTRSPRGSRQATSSRAPRTRRSGDDPCPHLRRLRTP
jgi:hypothetical protein